MTPRSKVQGFALMLAVFLIVTLAALGVYMLTISTGQLEAATQAEQSARAYQAARAGIDWGAYQMLCNPSNPNCNRPASTFFTNCSGGAATQTVSLGSLGAPNGTFFAEVACTRVGNETEGSVTVSSFRLTSTGCNSSPCGAGVGPTYVERQLQLTLTR